MDHMYDNEVGIVGLAISDWSDLVRKNKYEAAMQRIDLVLRMVGDMRVQTAAMASHHQAWLDGRIP